MADSRDTVTMFLTINNIESTDYESYFCIIKQLDEYNKCISRIRSRIVTIAPSWRKRLTFNFFPALIWQYNYTHNTFVDIIYYIKTIKEVHRSDITKHEGQRYILAVLVAMTVSILVILCSLCYILIYAPYKSKLDQDNAIRQLKELRKVHEETCPEMAKTHDVYISYDTADLMFAQSVLDKLEEKGYKVCFDRRDILYGSSQPQSVGKVIDRSRKTVAIFSPNYFNNHWCTEFEFISVYTGILNKEGPTNQLIIIKYLPCKIPDVLMQNTYLDWTDTTWRDVFFDRLFECIGPPQDL
jgi:hypothetical protein